MIYVGAALYNSAAYFNHSCYPDVIRYFVGTTIVLSTAHPLESGENISENYGPVFTKQTLVIRQRNLQSRYWFKCACTPCKENWPTLDKLNNKARLRSVNFCLYYIPLKQFLIFITIISKSSSIYNTIHFVYTLQMFQYKLQSFI